MTDWQSIAAAKRSERDGAIAKEVKAEDVRIAAQKDLSDALRDNAAILTQKQLTIVSNELNDTLKKLATAQWSASEVLEAYIRSACIAHYAVNPITLPLFTSARALAQAADKHLKETGKTLGPLHGLPVSLKDQFCVKGEETNMGYISWIGRIATEDSVMVQSIKAAGGIPFVRTNCPQTLMTNITKNHIYGETLNAHNTSTSCGGSSGGEGALIAMRASPVGVLTDIGGSVRFPAAHSGLFGLKPSTGRLPYYGAVNSMDGQEIIPSVAGPAARSLDGIITFTRAILETSPWKRDPTVPRMPWNQQALEGVPEKLSFAVVRNDGVSRLDPPTQRALDTVVQVLLDAGHEIIEWDLAPFQEHMNLILKIFTTDAGEDVYRDLDASGEPAIDGLLFRRDAPKSSVWESWQLARARNVARKQHLDAIAATASRTRSGKPIDAILSPNSSFAAAPLSWTSPSFNYTALWNLLDMTACVFPVTRVSASAEAPLSSTRPAPSLSSIEDAISSVYDAELFDGTPVGLQIIVGRHEEERCLGVVKRVGEALKAAGKWPAHAL